MTEKKKDKKDDVIKTASKTAVNEGVKALEMLSLALTIFTNKSILHTTLNLTYAEAN